MRDTFEIAFFDDDGNTVAEYLDVISYSISTEAPKPQTSEDGKVVTLPGKPVS